MKTILILLALLILLSGCQQDAEEPSPKLPYGMSVVVIDGCQYLKWETYQTYSSYCHKGNCTNHVFLLNQIDPRSFLLSNTLTNK